MELKDLIDTNNIVQRFLPKQTDIDKVLEVIRKKGTTRNAFTDDNKGNTGRIFE